MSLHAPTRSSAFRATTGSAAALAVATGLVIAGAGVASASVPHSSQHVAVPAAKAAASKVPIEKNKFNPTNLTVTVGQAVTWTNMDSVPHTVTTTSGPDKFDSGVFEKGKSFTYTFKKEGVYKYYCAVHPDMVAEVTVTKAAAKAAPAEKPKSKGPDAAKPTAKEGHPKAPADNTMPGMDHGDNSMPGMEHGDNKPTAPSSPAPASPSSPGPAADPVSGAVVPFQKHLEVAHFNRTAAQQVEDIVEFDSWAKSHEALFRTMLDPEVGHSSALGTAPVAGVFLQHLDAAHWNQSPMEQATAIANFDSWNKSHLAMIRMMFDPFVGKESALGTTPGTSVFMQHLDSAHWNQSANEQAAAITDDFAGWTQSHVAMFQAMASSLASGGSH